jgi:hypothetical protein
MLIGEVKSNDLVKVALLWCNCEYLYNNVYISLKIITQIYNKILIRQTFEPNAQVAHGYPTGQQGQ